ncbi:hypothetical protein BAUCODRAFT_54618, partial [Baudoinia panamericana UAMH 10762]
PPTHHHPSKRRRLSPTTTSDHLSTFLSLTETQPHLHPDAQLSREGIRFPTHTGSKGGLALHHLRRILAGLRGESLVAENDVERWTDDIGSEAAFGERTQAGAKGTVAGGEGDWQEREGYELEQRPLEGDVGDRDGAPVVRQNGAPPAVPHVTDEQADGDERAQAVMEAKRRGGKGKGLTESEKLARRAAKKERRRAEKRQK